ncbi:MAG: hypothetical protein K2X29_10350 [Candidatus Obscuribacterales bacterium]|jgi:hypothetical protein|nr:hypothetical protein [Candidatus Obscuribacterales bacterium]
MTIAEFVKDLQKYPSDMKIFIRRDKHSDTIEIEEEAARGFSYYLGIEDRKILGSYDPWDRIMTWVEPKDFKRKGDKI